MKFNDVVIYIEGDKEYNALVLGERVGNFTYRDGGTPVASDHTGENGEPLLTLQFGKQRLDPAGQPLPIHGTGQTQELVQIRVDVAHESHEYTPAEQSHFERKRYDGGRWREVAASAPAEPPITADSLGLTDSGDKKEE
jgi:hypothetical protein